MVKPTDQLSSKNNEWRTPRYVFDWLDQEFQFTLDAAASDVNHLCADYFTEQNSALDQPWTKPDGSPHTVFINCPYGKGSDGKSLQEPFWRKAWEESRQNDVTSVLLVPPRTESRWWHEYGSRAHEIRLLRGRISFLNEVGVPVKGNTFGSCIVVFYGWSTLWPGQERGPLLTFVDRPAESKQVRRAA